MTIYVGAVQAQVDALVSAVDAVPDLDQATHAELSGLRLVAQATNEIIDAAVIELDPEIGLELSQIGAVPAEVSIVVDSILGLNLLLFLRIPGCNAAVVEIASEVFAPDAFLYLQDEIASITQQARLLECQSYAGRIRINLNQATG